MAARMRTTDAANWRRMPAGVGKPARRRERRKLMRAAGLLRDANSRTTAVPSGAGRIGRSGCSGLKRQMMAERRARVEAAGQRLAAGLQPLAPLAARDGLAQARARAAFTAHAEERSERRARTASPAAAGPDLGSTASDDPQSAVSPRPPRQWNRPVPNLRSRCRKRWRRPAASLARGAAGAAQGAARGTAQGT